MKRSAFTRQAITMGAILVGVGLADGAFVMFAPHPLPWAAIIPALIPVLTAVFVILPGLRADKP